MNVRICQLAPVAAVMALSLVGCSAPGLKDGDGEDMGNATLADETANSLTANSLTANSLTANSLTANSLTANALTDPAARTVLKYIVGCALPADTKLDIVINGTSYSYAGQLGLAPSWGIDPGSSNGDGRNEGSCDSNCIAAVSSCVLARVNHLGQLVNLSVRGAKLLASAAEQAAYSNVDGTYYGNIFSSPQIRYACLPDGATELMRVCGPSLNGCVVTSQGHCSDVCNHWKGDGSYKSCSDAAQSYQSKAPISVYLQ